MKIMISGHRLSKLEAYDKEWIQSQIEEAVFNNRHLGFIGLSGVADGVDLWFLDILKYKHLDYHVYIPFEGQENYMSEDDKVLRKTLIENARVKCYDRNRRMVDDCDLAIVVWDGTKGGTYNCFQMLIENRKNIYWINPYTKTINHINNKEI